MKAVLISTYDLQGGAARAAYRLLQGLTAAGQSCSMVVREKSSEDPAVRLANLSPSSRALNRELSRVGKECIDKHRTPVSNTLFSLPGPGYDLSRHEEVQSADVIHLHWITGLLSPAAIGRLHRLGKPLIWTLHDQRPFTGGCHFSAGCRRFESGCTACPQLDLNDLSLVEASFDESKQGFPDDLVLVCPSRWMANCARASALFSRARIEVIPNGIDTDTFHPGRAAARQQLGWDPNAVVFLAGAEAGGEMRKGFGALSDAMQKCMASASFRRDVQANRIRFLFFGKDTPDLDLPVQALGHVGSEQELAKFYAAADAFLLPSSEDNFPNTMVESLCAGTPVIGFDVGGVPEAVESGLNGILVPGGATDRLAAAIQSFAADPELRKTLTRHCAGPARERYSLGALASQYTKLYSELTPSRAALPPGEPPLSELPLVPPGKPFADAWPALKRRAHRERFRRRWRSLFGLRNANRRD